MFFFCLRVKLKEGKTLLILFNAILSGFKEIHGNAKVWKQFSFHFKGTVFRCKFVRILERCSIMEELSLSRLEEGFV